MPGSPGPSCWVRPPPWPPSCSSRYVGGPGRRSRVRPMRTILVTGGAGFIGSHLAEAALAGGDAVVAVDDLSTGSYRNVGSLTGGAFPLGVASGDGAATIEGLVRAADIVYHLAAAVGVKLIVEDPAPPL